MPHYVTLVNFTDQGAKSIKDTTKRAQNFRAAAEKADVKVKEMLWTMGRYDVVVICEARDDEAISSVLLTMLPQGNVRTETLRGFTTHEVERIVKGLP